jgi:cytochrome c biogenesis protein ResB
LPPAGLQVKLPGDSESKSFWLVEGEPKRLSHGGHEFEVYFGRKTLKLPFSVQLEKFYKKDYPGTQTPISYESDVHVNNLPGKIKIAMNEPLKFNEFVLYQSSYELNPGQPPASIFSVNQDPGRSIKYTGSLILVLGIIIFTVARSSKFKKWRKPA